MKKFNTKNSKRRLKEHKERMYFEKCQVFDGQDIPDRDIIPSETASDEVIQGFVRFIEN